MTGPPKQTTDRANDTRSSNTLSLPIASHSMPILREQFAFGDSFPCRRNP